MTARNYQVSALFIGNDEYEACNSSSTFVVHKKNTTITVDVTNSTVGSIEYINVTVQAMNGTVLLTVNGSHYYSDVINGVASFNVTGLGEAIHTASITYMGNEEYNSNDTTAEINITKLTTTISIVTVNITEGQVAVFNITTSANFTEVVTVTIGDNNYTTFVENGKGTLSVYDLAADTYTAVVSFPGNTQYKPVSGSTEFTVSAKKDSQISITVHNITVVDTETIEVTVTPNDAGGKITIVIAGSEYTENITEGKAVFNINNLTARDYHVTAIYHGDTYYNVNSAEANFTVSKVPSVINLTVSDINEGEVEIINVTATPGATGVVLITIGDTHYYAELNEGKATFNVPGLAYGKYDAQVTYLGNDKYNSSTNVKSFTVKPKIVVEATTNNGNTTVLVIKVDTNASGDVNVTVNGQTYPAKVVNGTAKVNVSDVTPGETNVTVKYSEDGLGEVEQNMTVDIPKVTGYDMTVSPTVIKEGGNSTVVVSVPEDAKGNVTITSGNKTYTAPIENGTAKFDLSDLPVGSHDVSVSYDGDNRYAGKNTTAHINKVINLPTVNAVDHLVRGWNSQFDYEAVFTNEFGEVLVDTDVTFIINGKSYTVKTEAHGVAKLSETLPVGEYNVTSVNPVTGEVITKKLSIVPRLIQNKDITMEFMDGTYYTVRVIGDDGNPVGEGEIIDIYVNTIHYVSKTDKNGYARLKINLNPQKYKVMAEYKNYKVYNKLVVKQTLKLVKKTVSVKKSAKKLVLKAKLKWANGKAIKGKKIVFKFKGKKYTAKTNKKGIAQVTIKKNVIKKLKKGKTYKYSASYLKNTVKGKVKVKK